MKRFYKTAEASAEAGGVAILLDGRPVRTPMRAPLLLPNEALGEVVAEEWRGQGDTIDPAAMPLTGLANAAIDHVAADMPRFVSATLAYAETDTLCYRADPGTPLAERQDREWEPILNWVERRFDIALVRVAGIVHRPQPDAALQQLRGALEALDPFALAGLHSLTGITGSFIATLALVHGVLPHEAIWSAVNLEELWQEEQWGADAEARDRRERSRAEFDAAAKFCRVLAAFPKEPSAE